MIDGIYFRFPYGDALPLLGHPIKNTEGSSTYCKSEIKIKNDLLISHDHLLKYYITISRKYLLLFSSLLCGTYKPWATCCD